MQGRKSVLDPRHDGRVPYCHVTCVYAFGDESDLIKVGLSTDLRTRGRSLQKEFPLGRLLYYRLTSFGAARRAERLAHSALWSMRLGGEWFAADIDRAVFAIDGGLDAANAEILPPPLLGKALRVYPKHKAYKPERTLALVNSCSGRTGIAARLDDAGRIEFVGVAMRLSGGAGVRRDKETGHE